MPLRRCKTQHKVDPTVWVEIRELEAMANRYGRAPVFGDAARLIDDLLQARIEAMKYALTWQQGNASQRPSALIQEAYYELDPPP